ncbi:MAG: GNAT family N-acetyltransferase [Haloarculaceae archaeon]
MLDERVAVTSPAPLDAVHAVRREVFVEEQGVSERTEFDDLDEAARHFLAAVDGTDAGTARVRFVDADTAKIERVAVRREFRHRGVGAAVMEAAHDYARERGRTRALVHAQERVAAFYRSLGYELVGPVESDTDIPHVEMRRSL